MEVVPIRHPVCDAVVNALEELLAEAKTGDLAAFIMVKVRHDGSFATSRHGESSQRELVGSLEFAKFDLMRASTEG